MMPGSKGLNPHELAHRWVKDFVTRASYILLLNSQEKDMAKKQKAVLLSVICAVFIILLISISAVWLSGRNSVKKSVTFEAGDAIEAGQFLSKKKWQGGFCR